MGARYLQGGHGLPLVPPMDWRNGPWGALHLKANETWKLVQRPVDAPVLPGTKGKPKPDGSTLYKARWVLRGFGQIYGVNFDETFAYVVKSMSFKTLFAIMAYFDLDRK